MDPSDEAVPREALADWRQQHIGRLLLRAQRDFNRRAVAKYQALGYAEFTQAHATLLPHVDLDGTRVTILAERTGMTKQAVGQIVADLQRLDYVTRDPDPADGRAILVSFTPRGWQFLRDAYAIKREMEAEYAAILGEPGLQALRDALTAILENSAQHQQEATECER